MTIHSLIIQDYTMIAKISMIAKTSRRDYSQSTFQPKEVKEDTGDRF
jgi:hypothetical protein